MGLGLSKFVQNFYEIHASFSDINFCSAYDEIQLFAKEHNLSVEDSLYAMLGYPSTTKLSPTEIMRRRRQLVKTLYESNNPKDLLNSPDIRKECSKLQIRKPKKLLVWKHRKHTIHDKEAVDLLAKYYTISDEVIVRDKENVLHPFKEVLAELQTSGIFDSAMLSRIKNEYTGYEIEIIENAAKTCIMNGKLYVKGNPKNKNKLFNNALAKAINPGNLSYQLERKLLSLPEMAFFDTEIYLSILDYLSIVEVSYKDLLAAYFLNVPDYQEVYESFNYVPVILGDKINVYQNDSNSPIACLPDQLLSLTVNNNPNVAIVQDLTVF